MRIILGALATFAAFVLLAGWVALCSTVFWLALSVTPEGITSQSLQNLAWPFVTVLIAVPILAVIILGGVRVVGQLLALRAFLSELPGQVDALQALANNMAKSRELFESSKDLISDAASAIDQTTSQLADVEARLKRVTAPTSGPGQIQGADLVSELSDHLERAKSLFDEAATLHARHNAQGVQRVRGWILSESVTELRNSGYLSSAAAEYVEAALEIDRKTRRAGRANLEQADIDRLNRLRP
ncbi:MAG: hypothetical protein AB7G40_02560 [Hyphomonadaceae bacterium]